MARPAKLSGPVVAVAVDGRGAAWCDGIFTGDPEIVTAARDAVMFGAEIDVHGLAIPAHAEDALGATAALFAFAPGRTILTNATTDVRQLMDDLDDDDDPTALDADQED